VQHWSTSLVAQSSARRRRAEQQARKAEAEAADSLWCARQKSCSFCQSNSRSPNGGINEHNSGDTHWAAPEAKRQKKQAKRGCLSFSGSKERLCSASVASLKRGNWMKATKSEHFWPPFSRKQIFPPARRLLSRVCVCMFVQHKRQMKSPASKCVLCVCV